MKKDLILFPFNGNSIEALDCISNEYNIIGIVDDIKFGQTYLDLEIFDRNIFNKFPNSKILAVPGSPKSYLKKINIIESLNIPLERFATIIHPSANISKNAHIGINVLIMAGVVITSNAYISDSVIVLPNSIIHHDTIISSQTIIGSNVVVAGNVTIATNCYIGSGSNIRNNLTIGAGSLIGLGSNVIKSVNNNSIVYGNPAKENLLKL
jgi:sugar O-acyltransferase (sialic acid O-acetyltransferase NeuD family)